MATKTIVRNQFVRTRLQKDFTGESQTQQQFKDECDINNVVRQFAKTGHIHHLNNSEPNYGLADSTTYHDAMNIVVQAQQEFDAMPSEIRAKFGHSPENFLSFVENPDNAQELYDMGIINTPPETFDVSGATSGDSGGTSLAEPESSGVQPPES